MPTNAIIVSIVIPAFNAERFIGQSICSAQTQTLDDIEIIVCDDGSSDNTVAIVKNMARKDSRILLISNEANSGVSHSRNKANRKARGKWIAVLDADDYYAPDRLEKLLAVAEQTGAELVADNMKVINEEGAKSGSSRIKNRAP